MLRLDARDPGFAGVLRWTEIDRWQAQSVAGHDYALDLCDLCVRECPIEGAIAMRPLSDDPADRRRTPVVADSCVGCGVCENVCPYRDRPAIRVSSANESRHPDKL